MQLRCLIVVIWPVDVQSALRPDWGQSSRVGGVALATAVRCCKNAPMIFGLLRGEVVLPLSSTQSIQNLVVTNNIYCSYHN